MSERRGAATASADESPALRRFTLHVDFVALDEAAAYRHAEVYALGLTQLRAEVDGYTARVSSDGNWSQAGAVFCGAPGPDQTDVCTDASGHDGWHHGPGMSGRWHEDEVPRAPDVLEDLE